LLDHARWRVNLSGRLRVLASKQRNVHAGVVGMLADKEPTDDALSWDRVSYNPFRAAHFYLADIGPDGSRVDSTRYAMLGMNGIVYAA
jgi:hypothetical protein